MSKLASGSSSADELDQTRLVNKHRKATSMLSNIMARLLMLGASPV
jgi:hypothetical protein